MLKKISKALIVLLAIAFVSGFFTSWGSAYTFLVMGLVIVLIIIMYLRILTDDDYLH